MSGMTGKEEEIRNSAEDDTLNRGNFCYIMYLTTNIHGRTGEEPIELGLSIRRREKIL